MLLVIADLERCFKGRMTLRLPFMLILLIIEWIDEHHRYIDGKSSE
jgi:hypothetical protein